MPDPMTLGKKIDRMIADLSRVVSVANRARDFHAATLAQEAVFALGNLRRRAREEADGQRDNEWAEWIAWPPVAYPAGHEYSGLMDFCDLQRLREERAKQKEGAS